MRQGATLDDPSLPHLPSSARGRPRESPLGQEEWVRTLHPLTVLTRSAFIYFAPSQSARLSCWDPCCGGTLRGPHSRLHRVSEGRYARVVLLYGSLAIEGRLKAWKITRHKMARVSALARPDRSEWTRKSGATPTNLQEWRQNPPKKDQPKERGCTTMAIGRHWAEGWE